MAEDIPQPSELAPASPDTIRSFLDVALTFPPAEPLVSGVAPGEEGSFDGTLSVKSSLNLATGPDARPRTVAWLIHRVPGQEGEDDKVTVYSVDNAADPITGEDRLVFLGRFGEPVSEDRVRGLTTELSKAHIRGHGSLN